MLHIDTREKGMLPTKLLKMDKTSLTKLDAGDYHIDTIDGILIIERTRLDDFIGKIKTGRIDDQIERCKQLSDNVILLLEGMQGRSHSQMSYKSIVSKIASLSQRGIQVICLRNSSESFVFIKKLYEKHAYGTPVHEVSRVKPRKMSLYDQAVYMLMGVQGIGPKGAKEILEEYGSIKNMLKITDEMATSHLNINEVRLLNVLSNTQR